MPKKPILIALTLIIVVFGGWWLLVRGIMPDTEKSSGDNQAQSDGSGFNKSLYSIDESGSIWWIVNKKRPLPEDYAPSDLVVPDVRLRLGRNAEQMRFSEIASGPLKDLFDAAAAANVTLVFGSGYRSYDLQKQFYDGYVAEDGHEAAGRYSARPGTSEHQTGLAFDVTNTSETCHLEICFEATPEGQWVAQHAHEYGFIIRYLKDKESDTGYQYEPWHLRYVGIELATELKRTGQTMEEFFGL